MNPTRHAADQLRQAWPAPIARTVLRTAMLQTVGARRYSRLMRSIRKRAPGRRARPCLQSKLPKYSFGVWLRHLSEAHAHGLPCDPRVVCEIGPGATIGSGLAALITGAEEYIAVDGEWVWDTGMNLATFDALVELFRRREPRGSSGEFPTHILTDARMEHCLEPERLRRIRESVAHVNRDHSCIRYIVQNDGDPMHELDTSVDMIFSHAVMEHVGDLPLAYERMSRWLTPGGFISHVIDFRCHGAARDWNGHWAYSDLFWNFLYLGTEPLINRVPYSEHVRLMRRSGFELVHEWTRQVESGIPRHMLAPRFRYMGDDDLTTRGAFVQAVDGRCSKGAA